MFHCTRKRNTRNNIFYPVIQRKKLQKFYWLKLEIKIFAYLKIASDIVKSISAVDIFPRSIDPGVTFILSQSENYSTRNILKPRVIIPSLITTEKFYVNHGHVIGPREVLLLHQLPQPSLFVPLISELNPKPLT